MGESNPRRPPPVGWGPSLTTGAPAIHFLATLDRLGLEELSDVRWAPLTALMTLASAWWVKSLLLVGLAGVADLWRRRRIPWTLIAAALAYGIASGLSTALKDLVGRARPDAAATGVEPLVALPQSASFPSGHAATAFAAAAAVGVLAPRLRPLLLAVAALVAVSRGYLGVHFPSDVIAGALLGAAVGLATAWAVRRLAGPDGHPGTDGRALRTRDPGHQSLNGA